MSNVEGILSGILNLLSLGEGNLSRVLLGNSKVVGNLSLSLRTLKTLGNSLSLSNTLQSLDNSGISSDLLGLNLIDIIDNWDISIGN